MSWWGGGLISVTPAVECRVRAMGAATLCPGSWPPSPGLAPWAILICSSTALARYSLVTPKRPEATCLMALRSHRPSGSGEKRSASSPPSPEFERPLMEFRAPAMVSWASLEMEPKDMAPVVKRFMMCSTGSTSSRGTGAAPGAKSRRPRMTWGVRLRASEAAVNCLNRP